MPPRSACLPFSSTPPIPCARCESELPLPVEQDQLRGQRCRFPQGGGLDAAHAVRCRCRVVDAAERSVDSLAHFRARALGGCGHQRGQSGRALFTHTKCSCRHRCWLGTIGAVRQSAARARARPCVPSSIFGATSSGERADLCRGEGCSLHWSISRTPSRHALPTSHRNSPTRARPSYLTSTAIMHP